MMQVTFKTSGGKSATLDCEPDWNIVKVKEALEGPLECPAKQCKLIYKGRITKDADTLGSLKIADGHVVHVVKSGVAPVPSQSAAPEPTQAAAAPPPGAPTASAPNPFGLGGANPFGSSNPFAAMGGNPFGAAGGNPFGGGMPAMDPGMISNLLQNPMMQQMMSQITSNPDMMRNVINSNPMLQQMAANNPMLRETLSNPDAMRDMFNPQTIQAATQLYSQQAGGNANGGGVPDLSSLLGGAAPPPQPAAVGAGAPPAGMPAGMPDLSSFLGGAGGAGANPLGNIAAMLNDPNAQQRMDELFRNMGGPAGMFGGGGAAAPGNPMAAPGTQDYSEKVAQLQDMGFLDSDANLNALRSSGGNLDGAIEFLLNQGYGN